MANKIISSHIPAYNYNLGHISIDLDRKTAVLIRQSKKKSEKDHYETRLLQENLIPLAMNLRGEIDLTNILVYDEGAGISGTKGYDERPKLSKLYLDIANGIVGSVVVARPDRLFRDKHFLNVSMFTELAERTSDQGHVSVAPVQEEYVYHCHKGLQQEGYSLKTMSSLVSNEQWWALNSRSLDQIVFQRLCELAEHDNQLADRVKAFFESKKDSAMDESKLLIRQIKQMQERIARLDFLLKTPEIPLDVKTATAYAQELADLNILLPKLLRKQQASPVIDPAETITDFYYVLSHLQTEFEKQCISDRKQMMVRLVKECKVNHISPHMFHLYLVWEDGIATRPDVALLWRGIARRDLNGWTAEEDKLIRLLYPRNTQLEILESLPQRSFVLIRDRAAFLGVRRETESFGREKVNVYHRTVSFADLQAAIQYADGLEDKAYVCGIVNSLAENTTKGELSPYWPIPVDIVGFSSIVNNCSDTPRPVQQ